MAQFRGIIQGQRGEASRLGSKQSGLVVRCDGWHSGVRVEAANVNGRDQFEVYVTGGSNNPSARHIGTLTTIDNGSANWTPAKKG